jgi:hypothetical protein
VPCTDDANFAASTAIDLPAAFFASAAPWHMRQVSLTGGAAAGAAAAAAQRAGANASASANAAARIERVRVITIP